MSRSEVPKRESQTFGHNVQKWRAKRESKPLDIMSKSGEPKRESKTFGHNVQKWRAKKRKQTFGHNVQKWG